MPVETTDATEVTTNRYEEETYQDLVFGIGSFVALLGLLVFAEIS